MSDHSGQQIVILTTTGLSGQLHVLASFPRERTRDTWVFMCPRAVFDAATKKHFKECKQNILILTSVNSARRKHHTGSKVRFSAAFVPNMFRSDKHSASYAGDARGNARSSLKLSAIVVQFNQNWEGISSMSLQRISRRRMRTNGQTDTRLAVKMMRICQLPVANVAKCVFRMEILP
jgi:hypothetical protein